MGYRIPPILRLALFNDQMGPCGNSLAISTPFTFAVILSAVAAIPIAEGEVQAPEETLLRFGWAGLTAKGPMDIAFMDRPSTINRCFKS